MVSAHIKRELFQLNFGKKYVLLILILPISVSIKLYLKLRD